MDKLITKLFLNSSVLFPSNGFPSLPKLYSPILCSYIQSRNTYILKRRYPVKLYRKGIDRIRLKGKDYVYDLVEDTDVSKKPDVQVILKQYVEGIGQRGDVVTVKRTIAYNRLLVTGLADYATTEAIEKAKSQSDRGNKDTETYTSLTAAQVFKFDKDKIRRKLILNEPKSALNIIEIEFNLAESPPRPPDLL